MNAIGILLFGTKCAHDLGVCDFFTAIHGNVVVVYDVEGVSAFYALGGFVRAEPDALAETSNFVCIRRVPCWS